MIHIHNEYLTFINIGAVSRHAGGPLYFSMKTIHIPDDVWQELQRKRVSETPPPTLKELTARLLRKALRLGGK